MLFFSSQMDKNGCAMLAINISTYMNTEHEHRFEDQLHATITLREEGTGESAPDT